jgi:hypothetical protein
MAPTVSSQKRLTTATPTLVAFGLEALLLGVWLLFA